MRIHSLLLAVFITTFLSACASDTRQVDASEVQPTLMQQNQAKLDQATTL